MVTIRNKATKAESEVTREQWRSIKRNPMFAGIFEVVKKIIEPPEVVALKARQATKNKQQ